MLSPLFFCLVAYILGNLIIKGVDKGLIDGIRVGEEETMVSHLQYADDTILFISDDALKFRNTLDIVSLFEKISGSRINNQNSNLKGITMGEFEISRLATMANCIIFYYIRMPFDWRQSSF